MRLHRGGGMQAVLAPWLLWQMWGAAGAPKPQLTALPMQGHAACAGEARRL